MNTPRRLSDLVPGLVINGLKRTVTEPEVTHFATRYGSAHAGEESVLSASSPKPTEQTANHWLVCAIAEQLAGSLVGADYRSVGVLYIERLSWPNSAHAGDELDLTIEVLDKQVISSGTAGLVRWRWTLTTNSGEKVLDVVLATLLEDKVRREKPGAAGAPIACKVSTAAAMFGVSRYRLYEAIRDQELPAYRPRKGSDLMILIEDLRDWVTRHPVEAKDVG